MAGLVALAKAEIHNFVEAVLESAKNKYILRKLKGVFIDGNSGQSAFAGLPSQTCKHE